MRKNRAYSAMNIHKVSMTSRENSENKNYKIYDK